MKRRREFYIGWQETMPEATKSFLKKRIGLSLLLLFILLIAVVIVQKPFNNHQFELGQVTEITGIYYDLPVPILIANEEQLQHDLSRSILLVGYGKFGAEGIMNKIEKKVGKLSGREVVLSGTLIYGDGKTLMELTKKENSLIEVKNGPIKSAPSRKSRSRRTVQGEVLDPKCYFGVMKPGEGKVHKSCATRCISGGIPPVLRALTMDKNRPYKYYILVDQQGHKINKDIMPFIAEQIKVNGITNNFEGWDILYVNASDIQFLE